MPTSTAGGYPSTPTPRRCSPPGCRTSAPVPHSRSPSPSSSCTRDQPGPPSHILDFQPLSWTTHVAGHPPGPLLVFVVLDRIGLHGGGPAALTCVIVGATAPVAVAATLRALRDEPAARAALPFLVLFPGAVWVGASADGLFTGVLAAGLALLATGGWRPAFVGGLLLGFSLYLSYGLILAGPLALAVIALKPRARWATAGAGAAAIHQRPAAARSPTLWLPALALLAIAAADLSGLSKAEVERIWLPYEIWLIAATAWLPAAHRRRWLAVQALTALAVSHLLLTNW